MNILGKLIGINKKKGLTAYRQGIQSFNKLEYDKAIQAFEHVLSEKSLAHSLEANLAKFYCGRAYINVGITEFAKNNNDTALEHFQKALEFNPQDTDLNYFIAICLNNLGCYQDAMSSFSQILETEPWNIPAKLKIAITFHNMKMWKHAEEIHRFILKKHPNFADVHYHLGLALMSQNKAEEAARSFSRALSINPNYTQARLKLAMVYLCLDKISGAEENLSIILNHHPEYADVHYLMALVMEKHQDYNAAIVHLNQALEISPRFKNALVKKIIIHCKSGDLDAAQDQIKNALTEYPQDKRISTINKSLIVFDPKFKEEKTQKTAISLEEEYLIKELRNEFHKDLDIMPNVSEIITMFNNPRYIKEDSGLTEFLVPFITKQINRNPTYPDLYNSLGTQLLSAGKYAEAENAFSKALELNPDYVSARISLMKTMYKTQKYEEALAQGNYLLAKDLPFPDLYKTLAKTQVHLKLYEEAFINLKRLQYLRPDENKTNLLAARIHIGLNNKKAAFDMLKAFLKGPTERKERQSAKQMLIDLEKD